jgi:NTP pyrophosphatase (non-canonical NTP hydrolase)
MNDLNEYQREALSFRLPTADAQYAREGLAGEVGELLGKFAKCRRDGVSPDVLYVKKELGDILWMVAAIADDWGLTLASVADGNVAKLYGRSVRGTLQGSGDDR